MTETISVNFGDRWQLYQRLQELELNCQCRSHQPLKVTINSPEEAILFWSAVRNIMGSRSELLDWLKACYSKEWA